MVEDIEDVDFVEVVDIDEVFLDDEEAYKLMLIEQQIEKCQLGIRAARLELMLKEKKLKEDLENRLKEMALETKSLTDAYGKERQYCLDEGADFKKHLAEKYGIKDISQYSFEDEFFCLVKENEEDQ